MSGPPSAEGLCPHCDQPVLARWDVCRHCGLQIRRRKPEFPRWVPIGGTIALLVLMVVVFRVLGGTGMFREEERPGSTHARQACAAVTATEATLEGTARTPMTEMESLERLQRALADAKQASSTDRLRYGALVTFLERIVGELEQPGKQLPLKERRLQDFRLLLQRCEATLRPTPRP